MKRYDTRPCQVCGKPIYDRNKFCSKACRDEYVLNNKCRRCGEPLPSTRKQVCDECRRKENIEYLRGYRKGERRKNLDKCEECKMLAYCQSIVWTGAPLPCQPKTEEEIATTWLYEPVAAIFGRGAYVGAE